MNLIPLPYRLMAIALAVAALAAGVWGVLLHERTLGKAEEATKQTQRDLADAQESIRETERRTVAIQGHAHDADIAASAARADLDATRSADQQLRVRLAAAERARRGDPAASAAGPAAAAPELVPYDVFTGVDDAAEQLGAYADELRIHLDACIRSYQSLKP